MIVDECYACALYPCADVHHAGFTLSPLPIDRDAVRIVLISECAAAAPSDNYFAGGDPLFARTTIQAFRDAGADVDSIGDILNLGIYLTTAVKCSKMSYGIHRETVVECSRLLEKELDQFPNIRALLLMGDVANQAINTIARRHGLPREIPKTPTYKIRGGDFFFRGARVFPSYLQAGPSYFIEKSKREMIAQDIAAALAVAVGRVRPLAA